jgi:hypothetical protein
MYLHVKRKKEGWGQERVTLSLTLTQTLWVLNLKEGREANK